MPISSLHIKIKKGTEVGKVHETIDTDHVLYISYSQHIRIDFCRCVEPQVMNYGISFLAICRSTYIALDHLLAALVPATKALTLLLETATLILLRVLSWYILPFG